MQETAQSAQSFGKTIPVEQKSQSYWKSSLLNQFGVTMNVYGRSVIWEAKRQANSNRVRMALRPVVTEQVQRCLAAPALHAAAREAVD